MNELINTFIIVNPDDDNYTLSLLQYASVNGIINENKQLEIKRILDSEFIESAEQFTMRGSSTIPKKRAALIYKSILYQSDIYLKSINDDKKALNYIIENNMKEILALGKNLILRYTDESRKLFKAAFSNRLNIDIYEYNFIMYKAFDEFNTRYSARFDAENICTSIDYPLLYKKPYEMKSKGIVFIKEYYTSVMYENKFCKFFDESEIIELLEVYGSIYGCCYKDLLFNISEVVFGNFLSSLLIGNNPVNISLNKADSNKIYKFCSENPLKELEKKLMNDFSSYKLFLNDAPLKNYLKDFIPVFLKELFMSVQNNNLNSFIIVR